MGKVKKPTSILDLLRQEDETESKREWTATDRRRHRILNGYRLTTAEILYHMPDHPAFLQTYVWQELDLAPKFPILMKFLDFWKNNLDGPLHSVRVASSAIVTPKEMHFADCDLSLH